MGNFNNKFLVFDDDNVDIINDDTATYMSSIIYNNNNCEVKMYYEEKIKILEDDLTRMENNYNDLFSDYTRIKLKYEELSKKLR